MKNAKSTFCVIHSRCPDERYTVRLPFKEGPPIAIGESRFIAERCLKSLNRRFQAYPKQAKEYSEFLQEYESLGHMQEVPINHETYSVSSSLITLLYGTVVKLPDYA